MLSDLGNYYHWYKVAHVVCVIIWIGGSLHLSHLLERHSQLLNEADVAREQKAQIIKPSPDAIFLSKLERTSITTVNVAMLLSIIIGIVNAYFYGFEVLGLWFWIKMSIVLVFCGIHGFLTASHRQMCRGNNKYAPCLYRSLYWAQIILLIGAVSMVIAKPFD